MSEITKLNKSDVERWDIFSIHMYLRNRIHIKFLSHSQLFYECISLLFICSLKKIFFILFVTSTSWFLLYMIIPTIERETEINKNFIHNPCLGFTSTYSFFHFEIYPVKNQKEPPRHESQFTPCKK